MAIDLFLSEGPGLIPVEFGDWMAAEVRQSEINSRLRITSLSPASSAFMDLARAGTEAKREAARLEGIARAAFSRKLAEQGGQQQ